MDHDKEIDLFTVVKSTAVGWSYSLKCWTSSEVLPHIRNNDI